MSSFPNIEYQKIKDMTDGLNKNNFIGKGSCSVVYEGHLGDKTLAVKQIAITGLDKKHLWQNEQCMLELFSDHENIVKCFGIGEHLGREHTAYLILERIPYTLSSVVEGTTAISWADFLSIMHQISGALNHMHMYQKNKKDPAPYVFVDVKPENIMFYKNEKGCIAKLIDLSSVVPSGSFIKYYTMKYTSPEIAQKIGQRSRQTNITPKSDVYCFGLTILEVVSREKNVVVIEGGTRRDKIKLVALPKKEGRGLVSRYVRELWNLEDAQMLTISSLIEDCRKVHPNQRPHMNEVQQRLSKMMGKDAKENEHKVKGKAKGKGIFIR